MKKVKCIKPFNENVGLIIVNLLMGGGDFPIVGETYTVAETYPCRCGKHDNFTLEEIKSAVLWNSTHFVEVSDQSPEEIMQEAGAELSKVREMEPA